MARLQRSFSVRGSRLRPPPFFFEWRSLTVARTRACVAVAPASRARSPVSGGFAVMNPDSSLNINAVEAVPVDQLDVDAARRALADAQKRAERATSEKDKAAAEIEVAVYTAVIAA